MAKLDSGAMTIWNNDNWREIFDDQNATAVAANQATADLAPIINGKRCALSVASGGFVLLRNSTITGKADGAYAAAKAIPANTDLDGSYLTAISGGVANALNGKISNLIKQIDYTGSFAITTSDDGRYYKEIDRTTLGITSDATLLFAQFISNFSSGEILSIVGNSHKLFISAGTSRTVTRSVRVFYLE